MTWQYSRWKHRHLSLLHCLAACLLPVVVFFTSTLVLQAEQTVGIDEIKDLFKQAQKQSRKGRTADAEKLYRQIIEANPSNSEAKLALAYLLVKQRKIREAYDLS